MPEPLFGKRIVCATTGQVHLEQAEAEPFQFFDYSWICKVCGVRHCSCCSYSTDGETITVYDCGRFGEEV